MKIKRETLTIFEKINLMKWLSLKIIENYKINWSIFKNYLSKHKSLVKTMRKNQNLIVFITTRDTVIGIYLHEIP